MYFDFFTAEHVRQRLSTIQIVFLIFLSLNIQFHCMNPRSDQRCNFTFGIKMSIHSTMTPTTPSHVEQHIYLIWSAGKIRNFKYKGINSFQQVRP